MATSMDTDSPPVQTKIVSEGATGSGLILTLHPLVIMNISDQHTRTRVQNQNSGTPTQVLGALVGVQTGRELEIFDSYELPYTVIDGNCVIDKTYFLNKQEQFRQVFPNYDFLGWYSTGLKPTAREIHIHQQFIEFNESPIFLQLSPTGAVTSKELPITMYESVIDIVDDAAQMMFVKTQFKVETGEAERIAVDHVAHATSADAAEGSSTIAHLVSQRNAIKMLNSRIRILSKYMRDLKSGKVTRNHDIVRQIGSMCNRLPTIDSPDFREEFLIDHNDVLLMTYLATMTKGAHGINELVDKHNLISDRKQHHRNVPRGGIASMIG
ncbi:COP9 signalosome complex subunit 6 [Borealophlyctis nickersoniae]|nr:COP9 signalosome complex subunit 6 [Borealophlyctis nickersoniae]